MAELQKTPTLAEVFIMALIQPAITPLIKKPLFGKRLLPLATFLTVGGLLFEAGAVLGYIYQDRQLALERVIGSPKPPGQLIRFMRLNAKERVTEGKSKDENDGLAMYIYKTQVARLGRSMEWTSIDGM